MKSGRITLASVDRLQATVDTATRLHRLGLPGEEAVVPEEVLGDLAGPVGAARTGRAGVARTGRAGVSGGHARTCPRPEASCV